MPVFEWLCRECSYRAELGSCHPGHLADSSTIQAMCTSCGARHELRAGPGPALAESLRRSGDRFRVTLDAAGERRVEVLAALRRLRRCTLEEAGEMLRSTPCAVGEDLTRLNAARLEDELRRAGAQVSVSVRPGEPVRIDEQRDALLVEAPGDARSLLPIDEVRRGSGDRIDLEVQRCGRCSREGTLVSELPEGTQACPACGARALENVGGWVA